MALKDTTWYLNFGDGATTGYYAVPVWPGTSQTVAAGAWCRQLTTPAVGSERCLVAVVGGTTSASVEPTWTVTRGAKNTDGSVTWMECTGVPGPNGDLTNSNVWNDYKNTVVTQGAVIYDSVSGSLQAATTGGTAGNGATPSFSATAGTTTADNTVTWTSLGPTSNYTTPFKYPHARKQSAMATNWMAAGNQCFMASTSAETQASALAMQHTPGTAAAPLKFYSVGTAHAPPTNADLTVGATVATTGNSALTVQGFWFDYGIVYSCGSGANAPALTIGSASGGVNLGYNSDSCTYKSGGTNTSNIVLGGAGGANSFDLRNPSFLFSATGSQILSQSAYVGYVRNASFAATGSIPSTLFKITSNAAQNGSQLVVQDSDISQVTGTLCDFGSGAAGNQTGQLWVQNSKLGSGVTISTGTSSPGNALGGFVKLQNCDSGATNYRYLYGNYAATVQQETTIVRSGSLATDGVTPISWNMTSTANPTYWTPFFSEEIGQWNDTTGVAKTLTVFLNTATTLNNNDFWIEAEYLSDAASPKGSRVDSKMVLLGTPAALTSDGSSWGASGKANSYKCTVSFTPQMKGIVKLRLYLAKPSVTVYVDPWIYLS